MVESSKNYLIEFRRFDGKRRGLEFELFSNDLCIQLSTPLQGGFGGKRDLRAVSVVEEMGVDRRIGVVIDMSAGVDALGFEIWSFPRCLELGECVQRTGRSHRCVGKRYIRDKGVFVAGLFSDDSEGVVHRAGKGRINNLEWDEKKAIHLLVSCLPRQLRPQLSCVVERIV